MRSLARNRSIGRNANGHRSCGALHHGWAIWRLCTAQNHRIDRYEREREAWRSGAEGERVVARTLDLLPVDYVVFHDFNTRMGNFDHLVIGPTGIFAIETKNWRGITPELQTGGSERQKKCAGLRVGPIGRKPVLRNHTSRNRLLADLKISCFAGSFASS